MLSLKQTLGIVSLLAALMACIATTIRPPSLTTGLPSGLLFTLTVLLFVVAVSRVIAAYPSIDRFWTGFFAVCVICFTLSFSSLILSANTVPEHIARFIVRLRPLDASVSVHLSNERFYAMQRIVTNAAVLTLAVACGMLAQQRKTKQQNDNEHRG